VSLRRVVGAYQPRQRRRDVPARRRTETSGTTAVRNATVRSPPDCVPNSMGAMLRVIQRRGTQAATPHGATRSPVFFSLLGDEKGRQINRH